MAGSALDRHANFLYANRHSVYGIWKTTCCTAGIAYVPPHQAGRHSFATMINSLGVDAASAMEAGGWKDARLYLRTYVHVGDAARHVAGLIDTNRAQPKATEGVKY